MHLLPKTWPHPIFTGSCEGRQSLEARSFSWSIEHSRSSISKSSSLKGSNFVIKIFCHFQDLNVSHGICFTLGNDELVQLRVRSVLSSMVFDSLVSDSFGFVCELCEVEVVLIQKRSFFLRVLWLNGIRKTQLNSGSDWEKELWFRVLWLTGIRKTRLNILCTIAKKVLTYSRLVCYTLLNTHTVDQTMIHTIKSPD